MAVGSSLFSPGLESLSVLRKTLSDKTRGSHPAGGESKSLEALKDSERFGAGIFGGKVSKQGGLVPADSLAISIREALPRSGNKSTRRRE